MIAKLIVLGVVLFVAIIVAVVRALGERRRPARGGLQVDAILREMERTRREKEFVEKGGNPAKLVGMHEPDAAAPGFAGAPERPDLVDNRVLPEGNELFLSPNALFPELEAALSGLGFERAVGLEDGPRAADPASAAWRRGASILRYRFRSDIQLRALTFEGPSITEDKYSVGAKVPWLTGQQVLDLVAGDEPWEILLGLEILKAQPRVGGLSMIAALRTHSDERIRAVAEQLYRQQAFADKREKHARKQAKRRA